jgi:transcriptional antiterminator RfaH
LFKDYLFVRFSLATALRRVQHARAVTYVVHFGDRWPSVPEGIIAQLRRAMGEENMRVIDDILHPGDSVQINAGPMCGLEAVVTRVMPARQRVAVLLDFLGRQTAIELDRVQLTLASEEEGQRVRAPVWTAPEEMSPALD